MGSIAIEEFEKNQTFDGMNHLHHGETNGISDASIRVDLGLHGVVPPVAIVGMAMRLPGSIHSAEEFWEFLVKKGDARSRVPESRFNIDAFHDSSKPGSVKTEYGYFLHEDPAYVDAPFFSMSKYEAANLDPQQRLLLEVVWECLETGGQTGWRGKDIGCFVGSFGEDWLDMSSKDTQDIDRIRALGTGDFALSNRISYEYDLKGPSMTFRTGCSASMVALHEACRSLYSRECSAAIVAGSNLVLAPTMSTTMSDNMVLSPDGICKSFDASADGYGRGEAINAVFIKRLDDAIRDGDPIRAVIRSTTTNCDGRTPNITTPGAETQEQLIRQAYSQAKIHDISETAFFECHGTGTVIGDTTELSAVATLFQGKGVYIGAVKPNIGHSEGASGLTGIIKATLALENKTIPPNIHFNSPNPKIPFENSKLQVPVEPLPWPKDRSERVSINCFGIGGTNVHAILDSTASFLPVNGNRHTLSAKHSGPRLLVLSANSQHSLHRQIERLNSYQQSRPGISNDICFTLGTRREHLKHRAFTVLKDEENIDVANFEMSLSTKARNMIFIFTGQGAQWPGMGKQLLLELDTFRSDIKAMDRALRMLKNPPSWNIEEELLKTGNPTRADEPEFAQTLCTAVQIGLSNLLKRWGIISAGVIGHSSGEIAAAYSAGAITMESAIIISYYRGQAAKSISMDKSKVQGGMAAVGLGPEKVKRYLTDGVVVACENSPQSVTLSGDSDKLDMVLSDIQSANKDVFCRRLRVGIAYHSHHMQSLAEIYHELIKPHITFSDIMIPLHSSVTGKTVVTPSQLDASYWVQNLLSPVLFLTAVETFFNGNIGNTAFLEIGPHSALSGPLRQIFDSYKPKQDAVYIPTLIRGEDQVSSLLTAAGRVYMKGNPVIFSVINGPGRVLTDLPTYPWQHNQRYWEESRISQRWRSRQHPHHEILGSRVYESSDLEPTWRNLLRVEHVPWIWDHRLNKEIVFPCAGYIAMVGEAIYQVSGSHGYSIKNLFMKTALSLQDSSVLELVTSLRPVQLTDSTDSKWYEFTISSCNHNVWQKHCTGRVRPGEAEWHQCTEHSGPFIRHVESDLWYAALSSRGLDYGPRFKGLKDITADPVIRQAAATITDDQDLHNSRYALHPAAIDQCLQLFSVAFTHGISRQMTKLSIPISIEKIYISKGTSSMSVQAKGTKSSSSMASGAVSMISENKPVLWIQDAQFFTVDDEKETEPNSRLVSRCQWKPDIDFLPATELLLALPPDMRSRDLIGKISSLSVIECSSRIKHLSTETPHLIKYQKQIVSQANRMSQGRDDLVPEGPQWSADTSEARLAIIESLRRELEIASPTLVSLINTSQNVLDNCAKIIEGKISALEVLMENDGLKDIYDNGSMSADWSKFLPLLGHSNPGLRVLEIGAGVGSATAKALPNLILPGGTRLYSKYTFTDISPGVLPSAKERFKDFEEIEYLVLDITRDPTEQGFSTESFDLIIASNVLHATPVLAATLKNVRSLLVPGGRLLLEELCPAMPFFDFVMGVLPGWWLGEDDGRTAAPYVTPERWDRVLRESGFTGVEAAIYDSEYPYQFGADMISRRIEVYPPKGDLYLLHHSKVHRWAYTVESHLTEKGYAVHWCTLDQVPAGQVIISLLDLETPFFDNISEEDFHTFQTCISTKGDCRIIWVTHGSQLECADPRYGQVLGLARTLRFELDVDFSTFEIDKFDANSAISLCNVLEKIQSSREKHWLDPEYEFLLQDGIIHVGRFHWTPLDEENTTTNEPNTPRVLDIGTYGLLDSMSWANGEEATVAEQEVGVDMKYVGLNFRDIMTSLGALGDKCQFGMEGTGIISKVGSEVRDLHVGQKVLIVTSGLLRTSKVVSAKQCMSIPDGLSLEDATTMASVYATVILSIIRLGNLQKDQSILIHSACGGVGLAAIQLCQTIGAEIFVTVGNEQKRKYLIENYQIPEDHIFDSRSTSFLKGVMQQTNGRGVDLVLNSLSGELLHASWECVAELGRMIEIGKRDILGHAQLSMDGFSANRAYFGVDLFRLGETNEMALRRLFDEVMEFYRQGKIKPIRPVTVFEASEVVDAFRHMQTGKHMGKILIKIPDSPTDIPHTLGCKKPIILSPNGSYLLVGGLGGLGRAITTWMIERGARHFIFLSRSAGESDSDKAFLQEVAAQECTATIVKGSVADLDDVKQASTVSLKPIIGIIHMAMVLRDQTFEKMTYDNWNTPLASKVQGTWNLHNVFKDAPLDFFILFSSVVALGGNTGQANYTTANAFLDTFVRYRKSMNLPAWAINIGFMQGIGYASQNSKLVDKALANSIQMVDESYLFDALQAAMSKSKGAGSGQFAIGLGTSKPPSDFKAQPLWRLDARFTMYQNLQTRVDKPGTITAADLKDLIEDVKKDPTILDTPETEEKIAKELRILIGSRVGHDEDRDKQEIDNMAIDSLMTIEIRSWFRRNLSLDIPLMEISNAKTVGGLTATTLNALRSKYQPQASEEDREDSGTSEHEASEVQILEADTQLGIKLRPIPGPIIDWKGESEGRVFLTGATGFVGASMLASLLDQSYVKTVACLVRAKDEDAGRERIEETLKKYGIQRELGERLIAVPGDLCSPTLGLDKRRFEELSGWASVVFHLAAQVNYLQPYSAHREVNPLGTFNMLRFATNKRPITLHYSSSLSACGLNAYVGKQLIPEDEKPTVDLDDTGPKSGYSQSKYAAEMILWNAISNGIPVSIYRLGLVLGHSVTGIGSTDDAIYRLMSSCIQLGSYPIAPKQRNQFVPVDFVISCLLEISASMENIGHAYNVMQPDQDAVADFPAIFDMLSQSCPFPLRPIPYEDWVQALTKLQTTGMNVFLTTMEDRDHQRHTVWWDITAESYSYGTGNLRRALAHRPDILQLPTIDKLMKTWSAQWIEGASAGSKPTPPTKRAENI
ncbi:fatty acid synthase S-acetyltransferase [Nannizzia gypsea CBS 118893]|uniref:Fatty acid synthase S-acetyltransferase n=1 Tax=Arthroderma gypseum (strain ATCC MYA-4604 / CBS 118893) TaxID=535722 RepID=E4V736_ARTGP|nr:fatty acid synthase S-acetyltransferase [Nannizzia gypsea CBS 118893]EFQ96902.1 fatty acid synthase S-acetyltransferase [Nannizzia gypsea CBS 118893]